MSKKNTKKHIFFTKTIGFLGSFLLRFIAFTTREKILGSWQPYNDNFIYALWHNRQLLLISLNRDKNICALASASYDGDYIASILQCLGYSTVRGSTDTNKGNYKKSLTAARKLIKELKNGKSTAITVDGPLGPKYKAQEGVIFLSRVSGKQIIPVSIASSSSIKLKTWDNFEIPMPFAKSITIYGTPYMPKKEDSQENAAKELQERLISLTQRAETILHERGNL